MVSHRRAGFASPPGGRFIGSRGEWHRDRRMTSFANFDAPSTSVNGSFSGFCRSRSKRCGRGTVDGGWVPKHVMLRAAAAVAAYKRRQERLPLDQLARALGVHLRTLQAAARSGRLEARSSVRSAFGRPIRSESLAAGHQFQARHYRCFSGQAVCPPPCRSFPITMTHSSGVCVASCI